MPTAHRLVSFNRLCRAMVTIALAAAACSDPVRQVTPRQRIAIERTIKNEVVAAYDLNQPNVVERLTSLYAPQARIISASGGQVVTSRDSIRMGIQAFWNNVGRNMRDPTVDWTAMYFDVLSPTAAVMTAKYRIPHRQPNGLPHVVGGAWTAVFELRDGQWRIIQEHLSDDPYAH